MIAVVDALLVTGLIAFSMLTLALRDAFASIVLFMSNGLLLGLAWARLGAPDVAMAEAAIGAGLTGALLLAALRRLRRTAGADDGDH